MFQPPLRALRRTLSTGVAMTPVLTKPIRSPHPVRGWSHDRLARTTCGSRSDLTGHPRLLSSGYLVAAWPYSCCPARDPWLVGRRLGSPLRLVAPGAPGRGERRHRDPGPGHHRPVRGPLAASWVSWPPWRGRNGPSGLLTGNRTKQRQRILARLGRCGASTVEAEDVEGHRGCRWGACLDRMRLC